MSLFIKLCYFFELYAVSVAVNEELRLYLQINVYSLVKKINNHKFNRYFLCCDSIISGQLKILL